jgi:nicotinamide-nucleotide amidase
VARRPLIAPPVIRPERTDRAIRSMSMSRDLTRKAEDVIATAGRRGVTIVTAESCTAGALATLLADTPGAGGVFLGGFVTYDKACKEKLLGVPSQLIAEHTAVSRVVAERMAQGAQVTAGAGVAVAVTGVIGPEPDDDGNPVGLVHVAAAANGQTSHSEVLTGLKSQSENRARALAEALGVLSTLLAEMP